MNIQEAKKLENHVRDTLSKHLKKKDIIVARDNRASSDEYRDILVNALMSAGYHIVDVGIVPTPVIHNWLPFLS